MVTRRSDQPRSSNAINAAVEVIGDSCWLPVLRDVMFGNTSSTCRNDPKRESPRTSSPTASGGWSPAVSSPGARHHQRADLCPRHPHDRRAARAAFRLNVRFIEPIDATTTKYFS
jgi:hypothetical protein